MFINIITQNEYCVTCLYDKITKVFFLNRWSTNMATSTDKADCVTCRKEKFAFKCEGCSQIFFLII